MVTWLNTSPAKLGGGEAVGARPHSACTSRARYRKTCRVAADAGTSAPSNRTAVALTTRRRIAPLHSSTPPTCSAAGEVELGCDGCRVAVLRVVPRSVSAVSLRANRDRPVGGDRRRDVDDVGRAPGHRRRDARERLPHGRGSAPPGHGRLGPAGARGEVVHTALHRAVVGAGADG